MTLTDEWWWINQLTVSMVRVIQRWCWMMMKMIWSYNAIHTVAGTSITIACTAGSRRKGWEIEEIELIVGEDHSSRWWVIAQLTLDLKNQEELIHQIRHRDAGHHITGCDNERIATGRIFAESSRSVCDTSKPESMLESGDKWFPDLFSWVSISRFFYPRS
jgi:hypothetical protein